MVLDSVSLANNGINDVEKVLGCRARPCSLPGSLPAQAYTSWHSTSDKHFRIALAAMAWKGEWVVNLKGLQTLITRTCECVSDCMARMWRKWPPAEI